MQLTRYVSFLVLLALAGCGGSGLTPVTGSVTFEGKPLAKATIQLIPQGSGRDATGATNEAGEFMLSTEEPRDGVAAGTYKVVITPPYEAVEKKQFASAAEAMTAAPAGPPKFAVPNFPTKYTRADQTPLTLDVPVKGRVVWDVKAE